MFIFYSSICPMPCQVRDRAISLLVANSVAKIFWWNWVSCCFYYVLRVCAIPQIDIIGAVVIVWRARGKITRDVFRTFLLRAASFG